MCSFACTGADNVSTTDRILDAILRFLRSDFAIQQAVFVMLVSIIVIRLALGYFPPRRTKWSVLLIALGLLQLCIKRFTNFEMSQESSEPLTVGVWFG